MMTINISAPRGTRVSTPRPRVCVLAPATSATPNMTPFAAQHDTTGVSVSWTGVRIDRDATAMGPSAWSPPI